MFQAQFTGLACHFNPTESVTLSGEIQRCGVLRNCESLYETPRTIVLFIFFPSFLPSLPSIFQPLLPIEHNGPGLEYKVSYRRQDLDEDWKEHVVKRHSFVVKNTPTFVPYEIKIQARNHQGWGPEPKIVTGYSGEDCEYRFVLIYLCNTALINIFLYQWWIKLL